MFGLRNWGRKSLVKNPGFRVHVDPLINKPSPLIGITIARILTLMPLKRSGFINHGSTLGRGSCAGRFFLVWIITCMGWNSGLAGLGIWGLAIQNKTCKVVGLTFRVRCLS